MYFRSNVLRPLALIVVAISTFPALGADTPGASDRDAYNNALNHVRIADRITGLEVFATNHRGSPLAEDALQHALWFYLSTGGRARTMDVAAQLSRVNPDNPLALAVLAHDRRSAAEAGLDRERNLREADRMTNAGLRTLNYMRHPPGMTDADFIAMKRQAIALLEGDAGYIALQNKRYAAAQALLKNAVEADPESPQNVYALSLSYLNAPKPDRKNGFWYLARTVNLTQGTPAGEQIAQFASQRYAEDGGTPQNWTQFLTATRLPSAPVPSAPATQVEVAKANTALPTTQSARASVAPAPSPQPPVAQPAQTQATISQPAAAAPGAQPSMPTNVAQTPPSPQNSSAPAASVTASKTATGSAPPANTTQAAAVASPAPTTTRAAPATTRATPSAVASTAPAAAPAPTNATQPVGANTASVAPANTTQAALGTSSTAAAPAPVAVAPAPTSATQPAVVSTTAAAAPAPASTNATQAGATPTVAPATTTPVTPPQLSASGTTTVATAQQLPQSEPRTGSQPAVNSDATNKRATQTIARADVPSSVVPDVPVYVPPKEDKHRKEDYSSGIWKSPSADTPPAPGPIYKRPANGSPVSLGILIESAHLSKGERDALIRGITGILDDLRDSDEAFILTYGDELVFEQDLTRQPWLLQDALSHLKPHSGDQGLYDAIATSAAHLRRIAKNQNRVLLLISDGETSQHSKKTLDLGWSVREVTVHCMGVDVTNDTDRRFLEALSDRTGGRAIFVHDVQEFPAMSQQMARNIYGPMK